MTNIVSNADFVHHTIADVRSISITQGQQIAAGKSTIFSIKTGTTANNQAMSDLAQLVTCVKQQSEKFPQIAQMIALQDRQIKF